jgi:hypothetical protein
MIPRDPAVRVIKLAEIEGFDISIYDPLLTCFEYTHFHL